MKIVAETYHPGARSSDGGEYGERTVWWSLDDDHWARQYRSTGEQSFDWCPHDGLFEACGPDCPETDYVVVTTQDLESEIGLPIDALPAPGYDGVIRVDITGHDYVAGVEGGCCICHPADGPAADESEEEYARAVLREKGWA